jgi:glucose-1-phosphate cytidylyltransferase
MKSMKVVILAGGFGTRLSEETDLKPKPMVEIGEMPILWHIMKHYAYYGHKEFLIALGYKGDIIKRFFMDYSTLNGSLSIDLLNGKIKKHQTPREDWTIHLIDTGLDTQTGGRLKRMEHIIGNETFLLTYGDGVGNIEIDKLVQFHKRMNRIGTVTAVRPPSRFGGIIFDENIVESFVEKPQIGEGWINGGFFVFKPEVFDYIEGDHSSLENYTLEKLVSRRQLAAYKHENFWQCMDTLRDKRLLNGLWSEGNAPWKVWL